MDTINAEAVIQRLKNIYTIETDLELSQFLGVSAPTISNWKTRNSIDFLLVFSKCIGINYHYILTGEGNQFADNEMGIKLAQKLNIPSKESSQKVLLEIEKISQLHDLVSSLKDIFNDDIQASIDRLVNQYQIDSSSHSLQDSEIGRIEASASSIIQYLFRQLTHRIYLGESLISSSEKENLRDDLAYNILSTLSLSFGISTRVLPKPLKISFLMRRIEEILTAFISDSLLINVKMGLEEIIGPIIEISAKVRETVDIYLQFIIDHEKLIIVIEDYSEYNRMYLSKSNYFDDTGNGNNGERTTYNEGIQLARHLLDDVFFSVEHGRCIKITAIKYFELREKRTK